MPLKELVYLIIAFLGVLGTTIFSILAYRQKERFREKDIESEKLKSELSKKSYMYQLQLENKHKTYKKLMELLVELDFAINSIKPFFSIEPGIDPKASGEEIKKFEDEKKKRDIEKNENLRIKTNNLLKFCQTNRPFISEKTYEMAMKMKKVGYMEFIYEVTYPNKELKRDEQNERWEKAFEHQESSKKLFEEISASITDEIRTEMEWVEGRYLPD
jgi:hypothetical protein